MVEGRGGGLRGGYSVGCGHWSFIRWSFKKIGEGVFWGGALGMVWVESIVVCQVSVVLSKYELNLIINKEIMAILAKFNTLTLTIKVIQRSRSNSTCQVQ